MQELEIVLFIYSPESLVPISMVAQSLNGKKLKRKHMDELLCVPCSSMLTF